MNIELHIERLILDGLAIEPSQGAQVQAAVEGELMRLLSAAGLSRGLLSGGTMPRLTTTSIQVSDQPNPIDLGQQIAGAVYGGIGR